MKLLFDKFERISIHWLFVGVYMFILLSYGYLLATGNGFIAFVLKFVFTASLVVIAIGAVLIHTGRNWNPVQFAIALVLGVFFNFSFHKWLNEETQMTLDWHINKSKRFKIVQLVEEGYLQDGDIPDFLRLNLNCSPDKFTYEHRSDSTFTLRFYTDFGILDHYSAFIYSTDPHQIEILEREVQNGGNDHKLDTNWYRIRN